jgi:hypothetical protein
MRQHFPFLLGTRNYYTFSIQFLVYGYLEIEISLL